MSDYDKCRSCGISKSRQNAIITQMKGDLILYKQIIKKLNKNLKFYKYLLYQ